jgi:hypothetical protein
MMGQWRYMASMGLVVGTAMSVIGCSSMLEEFVYREASAPEPVANSEAD